MADPGFTFVKWTGPADCADGVVTMTSDTTCTATFARGPDLVGSIGQLTKTIRTTIEKLSFLATVQNIGDLPVPAAASLLVHVYLSTDGNLDGSDTLVFTKTVKAKQLFPGGVVSIKGKVTVPRPSQGKSLILKIDATDTIVESDEGNNLATLQIP